MAFVSFVCRTYGKQLRLVHQHQPVLVPSKQFTAVSITLRAMLGFLEGAIRDH